MGADHQLSRIHSICCMREVLLTGDFGFVICPGCDKRLSLSEKGIWVVRDFWHLTEEDIIENFFMGCYEPVGDVLDQPHGQ